MLSYTLILIGVFGQALAKCSEANIALYELRFETHWTRERFPKVYPVSRPHAEWSPLIGQAHNADFNLFTTGEYIKRELQLFVERGDSSLLTALGQGSSIIDSFSTTNLETGSGIVTTRFFADSDHHLTSAAVKIIPSPDWFVGVNSVDLCTSGRWTESVSRDLYPLDAGTQRGYTFSSPRWRSDPQEPIFQITHTYPNHTADAFYYPQLDELLPIASITIKLVEIFTKSTQDSSSMSVRPIEYHLHHTKTPSYTDRRPKVRPPIFNPALLREHPVDPQTRSEQRLTEIVETSPTTRERFTAKVPTLQTTLETTTQADVMSIEVTATSFADTTSIWTTEKKTEESTGIFIDRGENWEQTTTIEEEEVDEIGSGGFEEDNSEMTFPEEVPEEMDPILPPSETNRILPPDELSYTGGQRQCLVSAWSDWTLCSKTCGYGMRMRSREVVHTTGNVPCPELIVEQLCGSMKRCNWNHFSLTFNSTNSVVNPLKGRRRPLNERLESTGEGQLRGMLRGRSRSQIMREEREGK